MNQIFIAILVALAISIDNFVISVSFGLTLDKIPNKTILRTAFVFAFFALLLYLIGCEAGTYLQGFLDHDHYFASVFLILIGLRMLKSAVSRKKGKVKPEVLLSLKMLALFSIATSIDALVLGMGTSLSSIKTVYLAATVPVMIFIATFTGLKIGKKLSAKSTKVMQIIGSSILILLGIKVLISG